MKKEYIINLKHFPLLTEEEIKLVKENNKMIREAIKSNRKDKNITEVKKNKGSK